jgi:TIR domain
MINLKWVLVAGTGTYAVSDPVRWCASATGVELARQGFGLVTGGWRGVDHLTARSFAKCIEVPLSNRLIQVVPAGHDPDFRGGRIVEVPPGLLEFTESMKYSDAAILIGGFGGTYGIYSIASQERKPTFAFPATGGDANRVYSETIGS